MDQNGKLKVQHRLKSKYLITSALTIKEYKYVLNFINSNVMWNTLKRIF